MKNEALEKFETNLEKAKRLTKDNAAIKGIDLPDDNYFFKMLELAATPDKKESEGKPDSDTLGGLHLAGVMAMLPTSDEIEEAKNKYPKDGLSRIDWLHGVVWVTEMIEKKYKLIKSDGN